MCRLYLVKQLVRRYGIGILKQLEKIRTLVWVMPREAKETNQEVKTEHFKFLTQRVWLYNLNKYHLNNKK